MYSSPSDIEITQRIYKFAPQLSGVLSDSDLFNLMNFENQLTTKRMIKKLVDSGILIRWQRGFYTTTDYNLWLLATRLLKNCYISMDSVLAKNGLLGTISESQISLVSLGRNRVLERHGKHIQIYSIQKSLFFGFVRNEKGIPIANNEKAFLDLLYYYNRGYKFMIDPFTEIQVDRLDNKLIKEYLRYYKNQKFVQFVKGVLDDYQ